MINISLHQDLESHFEFLRELYGSWSHLMGSLIHESELIFHDCQSTCEFAKAFRDQDEELATLQYWSAIISLHDKEKAHLISAGYPIKA